MILRETENIGIGLEVPITKCFQKAKHLVKGCEREIYSNFHAKSYNIGYLTHKV